MEKGGKRVEEESRERNEHKGGREGGEEGEVMKWTSR